MYKKAMTKNRKALQRPMPVAFTVEIDTAWNDKKEIDISVKDETIEGAIIKAIEQFKIINKRDLMGYWTIKAHLQNGTEIEIPKKYWDDIARKEEKRGKQ